MLQFSSVGNVSMLVSSPDPPVIMSPAMGKQYEYEVKIIKIFVELREAPFCQN